MPPTIPLIPRQNRGRAALQLLWFVLLAGFAARAVPAAELVAPYVPTVMEDVERMLDIAAVGGGDYLIDLGAGDGRIVISAAQRGAVGHGVELDPELVEQARARAREAEVDERAAFVVDDIFRAELGAASVVTLYLMPEVNLQLRPRLLAELRPGTRVVSNSFDMGDWLPDRHIQGRSSGGIFLWIIPADVSGRWRAVFAGGSLQFEISQRYQEVQISARSAIGPAYVYDAALHGARLSFIASDQARRYVFHGHVNGDRMDGFVQIHDQQGQRLQTWLGERW
jgi:hypothetical protein